MIAAACTTPGRRDDRVPARRAAGHDRPGRRRGDRRRRTGRGGPGPARPDGRRCVALVAQTTVEVGIERCELTMAIGPWPSDAPDPAGPLGLASTPVIVLPDPVVVRPRRRRRPPGGSASRPASGFPAMRPRWVCRLLLAVAEGAEVVLVEGGGAAAPARRPGARRSSACRAPAARSATRSRRRFTVPAGSTSTCPSRRSRSRSAPSWRACLRPLALETPHHLVEVDPAPAFDRGGRGPRRRVARRRSPRRRRASSQGGSRPSNRRWRAQLEHVSYMCAISCSTRSSLARNGSLQSTVRCA